MTTRFVHLHSHSFHSIHNGTATPTRLARRAKELGMPAIALTDYCNLNGISELCEAAKKYKIKPILGIEANVAGRSQFGKESAFGLTLLAMNKEGWQNLNQLAQPLIDTKLLEKHWSFLGSSENLKYSCLKMSEDTRNILFLVGIYRNKYLLIVFKIRKKLWRTPF